MATQGRALGADESSMRELTIRGILLGGAITLLFTAANVYLGLKVGLTFATSIPAAVISMAVLRFFATSNILENNIVQTVASAAGTLAAIIFVLPGLVIVGWWQGFPFWTTALVCALGGTLGVMFSIPLRRALVADSPLPYPEGVAAAEVLKVGAASREGAAESRAGLQTIMRGSIVSALFATLVGMRLALGEVAHFFRIGPSATGIAGGLSMALIGAGHLVGISVGLAMLAGLVIGWGVATPVLTALAPAAGSAQELATTVWAQQVRFLGAGVIGVAAIWTLVRIIGPILSGIRSAMSASRNRRSGGGEALTRTDRDLPIGIVGGVSLALMVPIAFLLADFLGAGPLAGLKVPLIASTLLYVVVAGAFVAAVCGYMAGLIGASNSPISGVGILAVLGAALLLALVAAPYVDGSATAQLTAYALFATAIVFGVATISNDNLQDLKTGQLVGATPWKQQLALVAGVIFGSLVIPPVLDLLNQAYGFAGAPNAGPNALPAPQATLISALARGVLGGDLDWSLIGIGAGVGVLLIVVDALLGRAGKLRLPPLAVGIGIYLPMGTTMAVVVGAVLGWLYDRRADRSRDPEAMKRMGVLMATGMIVGESLFGVALAGLVVGTGSDTPLAVVGDEFGLVATIGGTLVFASLVAWLYRQSARTSA